jgi:hypothetical protein
LNPIAQKPSAVTLAQMFGPIRDDLRAVEREFARHVQSQVALIPTIGNYIQDGGGKRIRPAVLLMAARMAGMPRASLMTDRMALAAALGVGKRRNGGSHGGNGDAQEEFTQLTCSCLLRGSARRRGRGACPGSASSHSATG